MLIETMIYAKPKARRSSGTDRWVMEHPVVELELANLVKPVLSRLDNG